MKKHTLLLTVALIVFSLGMLKAQNHDMMQMPSEAQNTKAVCVLTPTVGNSAHGIVTFTATDKGVLVVADVEGLTEGKHGFHVHQYGDMTSADGTSAGGHFNPDGMNHGSPMGEMRHVGDLGNLVANSEGKAHLEWTDKDIKLNGAHSIVGRSIVVHAGEDDLISQPTGNAGARVAYGVIGIAK